MVSNTSIIHIDSTTTATDKNDSKNAFVLEISNNPLNSILQQSFSMGISMYEMPLSGICIRPSGIAAAMQSILPIKMAPCICFFIMTAIMTTPKSAR